MSETRQSSVMMSSMTGSPDPFPEDSSGPPRMPWGAPNTHEEPTSQIPRAQAHEAFRHDKTVGIMITSLSITRQRFATNTRIVCPVEDLSKSAAGAERVRPSTGRIARYFFVSRVLQGVGQAGRICSDPAGMVCRVKSCASWACRTGRPTWYNGRLLGRRHHPGWFHIHPPHAVPSDRDGGARSARRARWFREADRNRCRRTNERMPGSRALPPEWQTISRHSWMESPFYQHSRRRVVGSPH